MKQSTTIFLVGQKTLAREGLRRILDVDPFEVVGACDNATAMIEFSMTSPAPDLIVIDEQSMDSSADQVRRLRQHYPESRIVVLAESFRLVAMASDFVAGTDGYIVKNIDCAPLIESLKLVAMGEKVMPSELALGMSEKMFNGSNETVITPDLAALLSERELDTMRHLLMGSPNKVIANRLAISEATVKVHVKAILRKLNVQNRTQAAIWAVNNGVEIGNLGVGQSGEYQAQASA
ncbi:LuxR C-terminal-related transcriptional regulator [Novosphingobium lentum]|uniref:LuxR C-terminal-related transcriptional regulator n=1 Tax=Novosphingobium lentum TaxID=145287 RepID=UPI000A6CE7CC|nr:response regulator transcription factor [Novosphingobium lentum]